MQDNIKKMGQVMAKCWADEAFKNQLKADPAAVLQENGIDVPPGMKLYVHETTDQEAHIVIPPKPSQELSDEQLDKISSGSGSTLGTIGCLCIITAGTAYCH